MTTSPRSHVAFALAIAVAAQVAGAGPSVLAQGRSPDPYTLLLQAQEATRAASRVVFTAEVVLDTTGAPESGVRPPAWRVVLERIPGRSLTDRLLREGLAGGEEPPVSDSARRAGLERISEVARRYPDVRIRAALGDTLVAVYDGEVSVLRRVGRGEVVVDSAGAALVAPVVFALHDWFSRPDGLVFKANAPDGSIRYEGEREVEGARCHEVFVAPFAHVPGAPVRLATRACIGADDYLPRRVETTFGREGRTTTLRVILGDIQVAPTLDAGVFKLAPRPGETWRPATPAERRAPLR